MPSIRWTLPDNGSLTQGTVKIPEIGPVFIVQGFFTGNPVMLANFIIHMQMDGLGLFIKWAIVNL
jgi:hypothetical protein